ncbi:MAG: 50S ribosomal protein L11 methyltransferase [Proteobacteria bacterium]|nr:50S ribosomal protein L11 methyltransferase [Pseudomonadota bacterium]
MLKQEDITKGVCPYDQLYIYYLSGRANTDKALMGKDFIGNWVEDGFSFLFFSSSSDQTVKGLLDKQADVTLLDRYSMPYHEWLGEKPEPFHIGHFTVSPPWDQADSFYLHNFGANHILLDPGVVFGTGTHPTTRDCLELLELAVKKKGVDRVLDLGCGTGLLSLAAATMRCSKILAVDFNALAVKTTLNNIRLNGFDQKILAVQGLAQDMISIRADLLIANIHFEIMEQIIASPGFLDKKQFILSGLLKTQARKVADMLADLPVTILEKRSQQDVWHTFYGKVI